MTHPSINALPIARLHLTARAEGPLQLPPYAGSMLRGAFGHALLALSPLPHVDGKACALHSTCPYCLMFAAPPIPEHGLQKFSQMPQPYVIEPPGLGEQRLRAGETFQFSLVLIGKALELLPTLLLAWHHALRKGLGEHHTRCTLLSVQQENGDPLWSADNAGLAPLAPNTQLPPVLPLGEYVTLHFYTPLRLQQRSKPVRANTLDARTLLVTLARRWQLLMDIHLSHQAPQQNFSELVTQAEAIRLDASDLRWFDWGRYSQRQQQEMKLGGLVGSLQLHGELSPFAGLLHLGQWLHVGKNASFGLGGYRMTPVP